MFNKTINIIYFNKENSLYYICFISINQTVVSLNK